MNGALITRGMYMNFKTERDKFLSYLDALDSPSYGLYTVYASQVGDFWKSLEKACEGPLEAPICDFDDHRTYFCWQDKVEVLEIELFYTGLFDWFYMDKTTKEYTGDEDLKVSAGIPEELTFLLKERKI